MDNGSKIAVLTPRHNEEAAIATVVDDFHAQLPRAVGCSNKIQ